MKRVQVITTVLLCALMMCCGRKNKDTSELNISTFRDTIQASEDIDLDMADLFLNMQVFVYSKSELKEYGIADIRSYDRVDTLWDIVNNHEYHIYTLDRKEYNDREIDEVCIRRLVYTKEECDKIKKDPHYYVAVYKIPGPRMEGESDTIINHVLIHYSNY